MSLIETDVTPSAGVCPNCGDTFPYRSNKLFCSRPCKVKHHKRMVRGGMDKDRISTQTHTEARRSLELYDLNRVLSAKLYGLHPGERLGYIEEILQIARKQSGGLLRALLSNKRFIYPNPEEKRKFHRGSPQTYCTFPQACNRYLVTSPWNCYLNQFMRGIVPEPATGEVFMDGSTVISVDVREGDRGWKVIATGSFKRSNGRTVRPDARPKDPTGAYIHPWYFDGRSHRAGAKAALYP